MSKAQFLKDNLKAGEVYAGIIIGQNGGADYHLILLPGEAERVTWAKAKTFAEKSGGVLPNRRELRLLWVNAKQEFSLNWYWSSEEHASFSDFAWMQDFRYGDQYYYHKGLTDRARAVRRLPI